MKKIVFYGGGNIAQANIKGLISSGIKKQDILYIDRNIRNKEILNKIGIKEFSLEKKFDVEFFILAVKPKDALNAYAEICINYNKPKIISLVAGIKSKKYLSIANNAELIRGMPNTAAEFNKANTALINISSSNASFKKAKNIENWEASLSKEEYLKAIAKIKGDIKNGAYYELNYCMHFSASISNELDIYSLFLEINERTQSPFAAFVKINNSFLLCFSPERFLKKQNSILLSQPIKGTLKRQTPESNKRLESFINAPKERAENIMIVDLVRNDLSRICKPNSVQVPELCALKTFSHVHHLVSSVIGELQNETSFEDILEATFPMGSMTGAPKREVMQHIEEYESFKRGLYSGSIGYIEDGNFDLNVVIRSLQVHHNKMHYCVGGAIVYDSIAEEEYQECIAKRNGIMNSD